VRAGEMAGDRSGLTQRRPSVGDGEAKDRLIAADVAGGRSSGSSALTAGGRSSGSGTTEALPVWSSGVAFYPPSTKFWRIGGKWYDFQDFLKKHPGGPTVLLLARDRFEDCTFVFESHHPNYKKVRVMIKKYEVAEEAVVAHGIRERPKRQEAGTRPGHHDKTLDSGEAVRLLDDTAFYSVLRLRVIDHLRAVGHPDGGPTLECKALFWVSFFAWLASLVAMWHLGSFAFSILTGLTASWLGAFGHNWIHQPKYKLWAYMSLDSVGFSSDGWFREHLLQHHMYTNTPWDNHFKGTAPFLVTDPTVERNSVQRWILPYLNPLILCFGLYANYVAHTFELVKGNECFAPTKLLMPLQLGLLINRWGLLHGFGLQFVANSVMGVYYFTMALMNHNAEHCMDTSARNDSSDWAVAQLNSSADWGVQLPFLSAGRYLWLNYHTVHHLFPLTDFSHHSAIQAILMKTCQEFEINYSAGNPLTIYKEMVRSFSSPRSLMQEVLVYAGGL